MKTNNKSYILTPKVKQNLISEENRNNQTDIDFLNLSDKRLDMLAKKISLRLLSMEEYLNRAQASAYSKIGQKRLISLVKKGKIKGYSDKDNKGQWIILKSSLKRYRLIKMKENERELEESVDEEKILESLRRKAGLQ